MGDNDTAPDKFKLAYQATLDEEWDRMIKIFEGNKRLVTASITITRDTALHLAVHSKKKKPLESLLSFVPDKGKNRRNAVMKKNADGNTILHEAAAAGNLEAVEYLLSVSEQLIKETNNSGENSVSEQLITEKNNFGETPFFTAASFGREDIVDYIYKTFKVQIMTTDGLLKEHRRRNDSKTILYAAIQGLHFGTACKLLELDSSLGDSKDLTNGMTYLHLLAEMPFAFRSGCTRNECGKFLYSCKFRVTCIFFYLSA